MKNNLVSNFIGTNVGVIIVVIVPTAITYVSFFSNIYNTIEQKLINMQNFELLRITVTATVFIISLAVVIYFRLSLKQTATIEYIDLLREDAAEINNYLIHCSQNRIMQIQSELQERGLISSVLPNVITEEEKRLHNELCKKRQEKQIELYEFITGKKYEFNRN